MLVNQVFLTLFGDLFGWRVRSLRLTVCQRKLEWNASPGHPATSAAAITAIGMHRPAAVRPLSCTVDEDSQTTLYNATEQSSSIISSWADIRMPLSLWETRGLVPLAKANE